MAKHKKPMSYLELADRFIQQEEANFKLFNSVKELTTQVESTENEVLDLSAQVEKLKTKKTLEEAGDQKDNKDFNEKIFD